MTFLPRLNPAPALASSGGGSRWAALVAMALRFRAGGGLKTIRPPQDGGGTFVGEKGWRGGGGTSQKKKKKSKVTPKSMR